MMIKRHVAQSRDGKRDQRTQKPEIGISFFSGNIALRYFPNQLYAGRHERPDKNREPQEADAGDKLSV